jgi:hypothetical protein
MGQGIYKAELGEMTVAELDVYIRELRGELEWAQRFVYKAVAKRIEVAEKVRAASRARGGWGCLTNRYSGSSILSRTEIKSKFISLVANVDPNASL